MNAKAPKILHRQHLTVRPEIDESQLPFVAEVRRKTKSGKYLRKTHYWRAKKGADSIDGLQYAVDLMNLIKTNRNKSQTARLIGRILQDMGDLYSGDWLCKNEFLKFVGAMLIFAAEHGDYGKFAEKQLEQLLQSEPHNPDHQDEADEAKVGAA